MELPTNKAPHLLAPGTVGAIDVRNRVFAAPLTRGRAGPTRVPNDDLVQHYADRAVHSGLIFTEATTVSESANGWTNSAGLYTREQMEGWKRVNDAVHANGGRIVYQMWHMGRAAHSSFLGGEQIVAPSAITINGANFGSDGVHAADGSKKPYEEPRALTIDEIAAIVEDYRRSATLAKEAGFDGIEVHSANGYLLDTFLQSSTNKRTDAYGGPVENRMRLLNEILDAILTVWDADRVGVRLSPNGVYNDMGSEDNIETFTYALQQLRARDLAFVHVMDGLGFGFHKKTDAFTLEAMQAVYQGTLIGNCGYTRDTAEAAIAAGNATAISFGRPFIANPDLPFRFAHDIPLAESDPSKWFGGDSDGYNTYDFAEVAEIPEEQPTASVIKAEAVSGSSVSGSSTISTN
uniref:NADH:flavin oxidoreductase/NADH oxidase N-terminal domain-containing protein n=1 Tax=Phaeomonas parva TaxID=124430 RepID=A0A7S1ULZ3_9STRA|mmetsp:Transcript_8584/g.24841  ORF Transcript_8584/g.24841 Transcript_8584/m.24841 type:complete len:406 (+) Transcript_8584:512-1729(+)